MTNLRPCVIQRGASGEGSGFPPRGGAPLLEDMAFTEALEPGALILDVQNILRSPARPGGGALIPSVWGTRRRAAGGRRRESAKPGRRFHWKRWPGWFYLGLFSVPAALFAPGAVAGAAGAAAAAVADQISHRQGGAQQHQGQDQGAGQVQGHRCETSPQTSPRARPRAWKRKAHSQATQHWSTTTTGAQRRPISRRTAAMAATQGV